MTHTLSDLFSELEGKIAEEGNDWSANYFRNHQRRYRGDLEIIQTFYKQGEILEVGSAPYHLTYLMNELGWPVQGVDIDPSRQAAFIHANKLKIAQSNVETQGLPFDDNSFHFIIFNEIFEHLRINPIETLKEVNRVLHPDGHLLLSTPNFYRIQSIGHILLGKGFDDPYDQFEKLEKLGHMGHVREYTIRQVRKFLRQTGFEPVKLYRRSYARFGVYGHPLIWSGH